MKPTIDARGLSCPKPVLECKEFIEKNKDVKEFLVMVDNEASKENVSRFLKSKGFFVEVNKKENEFEISARKVKEPGEEIEKAEFKCECEVSSAPKKEIEKKELIFITTDSIGRGDDELGKKLMKNFLATLPEMGDTLWRIILVNGGVKLAVKGSFVIDELKRLEKMGVSILVCGTCLDHFNLLDKKEIGETTNMLDVVTSLQLASKVIKI